MVFPPKEMCLDSMDWFPKSIVIRVGLNTTLRQDCNVLKFSALSMEGEVVFVGAQHRP